MAVQDPNVVSTNGAVKAGDLVPGQDANARAEQIIEVSAYQQHDGVSVVSVAGEIDMLSAPELRSCVSQQLGGCSTLVLDLTNVSFLGSAGLAVLVEALQHSKRRGIALRIVAVERAVTRPLVATGLGDVFSVYPTLADATAA